MSLTVRPYNSSEADLWDSFCQDALQGTFLHTRRFLSYHGDRLCDKSLIIEDKGKWVGLFPAALDPDDPSCIVSHPGITYGGVLHQGKLRGESMIQALAEMCRHYCSHGYLKLLYKAVPNFYHRSPAQDDLYGLFRLGGVRYRCDLSCTINVDYRLPVSERRRRSLKKAVHAGLKIVEGSEHLPAFWEVLTENLASKHGVRPVHTLQEISHLTDKFPEQIRCVCASASGKIVAGILLFITYTTYHAQYIASNANGSKVSALDFVFAHCLERTKEEGRRWFDFGTSNENQGMVLNNGLYNFKSEFGGGGTVYEFYELNLEKGVIYAS